MFDKLLDKNIEVEEIREIEPGRENRTQKVDEYKLYIEEPCSHFVPTLKTWLDYWEKNKTHFPKLYKLSQKYVCYLGSSCASERLFSYSGEIHRPKRSRLLPYRIEELCILHAYIESDGIDLFEGILFKKE